MFGERQGLHAPELTIGPWHIQTDKDFYFVLIPITILLVLFARNIVKTKVGRAFISIRDADIAAETMGVNLTLYKTLAFAVSAFYAGVGGGLYAFVLRFIEPELFNMFMSVMFLTMAVVGGLGSMMGPVAGACLLGLLDLQLRNILEIPYFGQWIKALSETWFSMTGVSNIQLIIFGLILVPTFMMGSIMTGFAFRYPSHISVVKWVIVGRNLAGICSKKALTVFFFDLVALIR